MKNDFRLVFAGTPAFAATALETLLNEGFDVVAAYTQPDRPAGRGMKLTPSAVKQLALARVIPVLQPPTLKTPEAQAELAALKPDLMIVAAYGLILPQAVLDIPRLGCLNIHASLLPRWRGAAPIQRAILAGDAETGVCIMRMEAGLDTGAVLHEVRTPISDVDTAGTLHDRLAEIGSRACVAVVGRLARGEAVPEVPQPEAGVTYAQKITPEEARIDWSRPADDILRAVRAFNPVPGAWTTWRGEKLKIWSAHAATDAAPDSPLNWQSMPSGTIVRSGRALQVICGSGQAKQRLTLHETQVAGAKRMPTSLWCGAANSPVDGDRLGDA